MVSNCRTLALTITSFIWGRFYPVSFITIDSLKEIVWSLSVFFLVFSLTWMFVKDEVFVWTLELDGTTYVSVGKRKWTNNESKVKAEHSYTHSWKNSAFHLGFFFDFFLCETLPFVIFQLKVRIEKKTSISIQNRSVIEQTIPTLVTGTGFPKQRV